MVLNEDSDIVGYNLYRKDREEQVGGGIALYIDSHKLDNA